MHLKDLVGKPIKELTTEEVEEKINALRKLNFKTSKAPSTTTPKSKPAPKPKSNKDKQIENAVKGMTPEQRKLMMERLGI